MQISFVHKYFLSWLVISNFCTEHGSFTAVLCAEFWNDWIIEMEVMEKWDLSWKWVLDGTAMPPSESGCIWPGSNAWYNTAWCCLPLPVHDCEYPWETDPHHWHSVWWNHTSISVKIQTMDQECKASKIHCAWKWSPDQVEVRSVKFDAMW